MWDEGEYTLPNPGKFSPVFMNWQCKQSHKITVYVYYSVGRDLKRLTTHALAAVIVSNESRGDHRRRTSRVDNVSTTTWDCVCRLLRWQQRSSRNPQSYRQRQNKLILTVQTSVVCDGRDVWLTSVDRREIKGEGTKRSKWSQSLVNYYYLHAP